MVSIRNYSTTAASNTSLFPENMPPSAVNDGMREVQAELAKLLVDNAGTITTGGTANAHTLTLSTTPASLADGLAFAFTAGATNSGATTLVVTPNGAAAFASKAIRKNGPTDDVALSAGDIVDGNRYAVQYEAAANGAAGGYILLNPTTGAHNVVGDLDVTADLTANTLAVGSGGAIVTKLLTGTRTNDFGNIGAGATATTTASVVGAASGGTDVAFVGSNAIPNEGIVYQAYVSAADIVTITATNITTSTVNPGNQTFRVLVFNAT